MTPDEQLRIAVQAASEYAERRRFTHETREQMGWITHYAPAPPPDWKAPDMGHILAALRALGVVMRADCTVEEKPKPLAFPDRPCGPTTEAVFDDGRDWRTIDFDGDAYPAFDVAERLRKLGYAVQHSSHLPPTGPDQGFTDTDMLDIKDGLGTYRVGLGTYRVPLRIVFKAIRDAGFGIYRP